MELRNIQEEIGRIAKPPLVDNASRFYLGSVYGGNSSPSDTTNNNYWSIPVVNAKITVADWTATKYTLPSTFAHGDSVLKMDDGLCWVRLLSGTDALNGSVWNADATPNAATVATSKPPNFLSAYVSSSATTQLVLQFDSQLTGYDMTPGDFIVSPSIVVSGVSVAGATGRVTLTLASAITGAGYKVSIPFGAAINAAGKSSTFKGQVVQFISAKFCYVLCANIVGYVGYVQGDMVGIAPQKTTTIVDGNNVSKNIPIMFGISAMDTHRHMGDGGGRTGGGWSFSSPIAMNTARIVEIGGTG